MAAITFPLPILGFSAGFSPDQQQPGTSGYMLNVRPLDVLENRIRLGQRPGLDKWGSGTQVGAAEEPVVAMAFVDIAE